MSFPLSRAMICVNCDSLFDAQPMCPACQSDVIYPVETWLPRTHDALILAELDRLGLKPA